MEQTVLNWTSCVGILHRVILHSIIRWPILVDINLTTAFHRGIVLILLAIVILRVIHAYRLYGFERCLIGGGVRDIRLLINGLLPVAFGTNGRRLLQQTHIVLHHFNRVGVVIDGNVVAIYILLSRPLLVFAWHRHINHPVLLLHRHISLFVFH